VRERATEGEKGREREGIRERERGRERVPLLFLTLELRRSSPNMRRLRERN
jgi:hypothetical protein